jgi:hypothetical protein
MKVKVLMRRSETPEGGMIFKRGRGSKPMSCKQKGMN